MTRRIARLEQSVILYDDSLLSHARPELFTSANWPGAAQAPGYSGGRGNTLFIRHEDHDWVLRHYHRGGQVGRFLADSFIWVGEQRTRCFQEFDLLATMTGLGLPVPQPVAAHYRRRGPWYTQDLITVRLPGVEPLSTRLARGPLPTEVWRAVGACVAGFHAADVFHADLTAHNLQIDSANRIWLLDFDRGRRRRDAGAWRLANLARLRRSLTKIRATDGVAFGSEEWASIEAGYRAAGGRA